MKKYLLLIFIVFYNIISNAQDCRISFESYIQEEFIEIRINCDTIHMLKIDIVNGMADVVNSMEYLMKENIEYLQINFLFMPKDVYFIRVFDGIYTHKMSIIKK